MRVTTEFWVSSIVRRAFSAGGFAAIARRGATEAGAVIVTMRERTGETRVFSPAPQASYDEARPEGRVFSEVMRATADDDVRKYIEREAKFDPDVWVVELEVDEALFSELVPVTTP